MVRGKFRVLSRKVTQYPGVTIELGAVSHDGTPENERFHRYTPSGTITMTVDNPAADAEFQPGREFYVDFTPVEEVKKVERRETLPA